MILSFLSYKTYKVTTLLAKKNPLGAKKPNFARFDLSCLKISVPLHRSKREHLFGV